MGSFDAAGGADDEDVIEAVRDFYSGTITHGVNSEVSILTSEDTSFFSSINRGVENIGSTMRWKNGESNNGPGELVSEKTFLVLKDEQIGLFEPGTKLLYKFQRNNKPNDEESKIRFTQRSKTKSASVNLENANTWPPKLKKSSNPSCVSLERPKTANLEEPTLLDPRLVDKLDMSMLSKELLCDSMTHMRLINCRGTTSGQGIERRRQSLNIPSQGLRREFQEPGRSGVTTPVNSGIISLARQKRRSFEPLTDSELAYDLQRRETSPEVGTNTFAVAATTTTTTTIMKKQGNRGLIHGVIGTNDQPVIKRLNSESRSRDDNNNKSRTGSLTPKISALNLTRKKSSKISIKSDVELFTGTITTNVAPEPCKTCGRSDQPERFHSHPKNTKIQQPQIKLRDNSAPQKSRIAVPKSIQKPVALNFRSEKRTPSKNIQQDNNETEKKTSPVTIPPSPKRGPRSVTCYICSREFGTASFPIHEPKCLQKWERENNALPPSQRRAVPPQRPEAQPGHQSWNKAAWEQSQAQLVPCSRCGRTFLPDRLLVHEKSCKIIRKKQPMQKSNHHHHQESSEIIKIRDYQSGGSVNQVQSASTPIAIPKESPMVFCRICGRSFGSKSIKIHEPQCLKRSHKTDNDGLTSSNNRNNPEQPSISDANSFTEISIYHKKTVPCYICGRDFGSTSIGIHEPQCLRKWYIENEKLPQDQRRKQPEKPEVVLKRDVTGAEVIDQVSTAEANWRSHLGQLVPCKRCGRTFNPDRVSVHERGCKGTR